MPLKLRDVRPQPLLQPPSDEGWGRLAPGEEKVVRESLRVMGPFTVDNLRLHYYMRRLGVGEPLSVDERMMTAAELDGKRAGKNGWMVAVMHWMMREAGVGAAVTDEDRRLMSDAKRIHGCGPNMWAAVETGMLMRALGVSESVEEYERSSALKLIEKSRKSREGLDLSRSLHASYEMGMGCPPTEEDLKIIGESLDSYLSGGLGLNLAETRYRLGELAAAAGKRRGPDAPVPPLKRFGR